MICDPKGPSFEEPFLFFSRVIHVIHNKNPIKNDRTLFEVLIVSCAKKSKRLPCVFYDILNVNHCKDCS